MTTMLLDDKASEGLSDDEETALIEIMSCCCRQAATGQGPPGRFVKRVSGMIENQIYTFFQLLLIDLYQGASIYCTVYSYNIYVMTMKRT